MLERIVEVGFSKFQKQVYVGSFVTCKKVMSVNLIIGMNLIVMCKGLYKRERLLQRDLERERDYICADQSYREKSKSNKLMLSSYTTSFDKCTKVNTLTYCNNLQLIY